MAVEPYGGDGRLLGLLLDAKTSRGTVGWVLARANTLQAVRELLEPLSLQQRLPLFHH